MPLKHFTETILIVLLAAVTVAMAIIVHSVPVFPRGFVPLLLLTVVGLLYAGALYPMLKRNRADYPFRMLHFVPAAIPFLALLLQLLVHALPALAIVATVLFFGWMLPLVGLLFLGLALFCLNVIRRRVPRLTLLTILFVPFLTLGLLSERLPQWNSALAMLWLTPDERTKTIALEKASQASILGPGETWGARLEQDLAQRQGQLPLHPVKKPNPPHLPSAGPGMDLAFVVIAAYCAALQIRSRKRLQLA